MLEKLRPILFCTLAILASCNTEQSLENDEIVVSIFSSDEIKDLSRIHDFFSDEICQTIGYDNSKPNDCFEKYLEENRKTAFTGSYPNVISEDLIEEMLQSLESNVFDEIWKDEIYIDEWSRKHEFISIKNFNSKYVDFLESVGKHDSEIRLLLKDLQSSGTLGSTDYRLIAYPNNFNTEDVKIRLIIAIHFITIFSSKDIEAPE